jgi:RNA polymerase sigma factor (sigma-70 family)
MTMSPASVVHVVDDDASIRNGFQRLLRSHGWQVHAFASAAEFDASGVSRAPGCLLLDLRMPGGSGLELLERLEAARSPLAVVVVTGFGDVPSTVRAMRHGAIDFLTKPVSEEQLVEGVTTALARSDARWRRQRDEAIVHARLDRLTPREREVCGLVARGMLNKQIAAALGTSEKTVKVHRARVMAKLEVGSVAELVRLVDRTPPSPAREPPRGASPDVGRGQATQSFESEEPTRRAP